jgi:hypothetical protein
MLPKKVEIQLAEGLGIHMIPLLVDRIDKMDKGSESNHVLCQTLM